MVVQHRAAAGRHAGEVAVAAAAGGRHPAVTGVIERVCVMVLQCISDRQAAARGTGVARIDTGGVGPNSPARGPQVHL